MTGSLYCILDKMCEPVSMSSQSFSDGELALDSRWPLLDPVSMLFGVIGMEYSGKCERR